MPQAWVLLLLAVAATTCQLNPAPAFIKWVTLKPKQAFPSGLSECLSGVRVARTPMRTQTNASYALLRCLLLWKERKCGQADSTLSDLCLWRSSIFQSEDFGRSFGPAILAKRLRAKRGRIRTGGDFVTCYCNQKEGRRSVDWCLTVGREKRYRYFLTRVALLELTHF